MSPPRLPYRVRLNTTVRGVSPPALLRRFGWWLATQRTGSVGLLDLHWTAYEHDPEVYCFARLPGHQRLALRLTRNASSVLLLDPSGRNRVIAKTLAAFLRSLAAGDVPIRASTNESARAELATWLRLNRRGR